MAPYFNFANEADLKLLPAWARSHSELEWLATQVEADVIRYYTRPLRDEFEAFRIQDALYPMALNSRTLELLGNHEAVYLWGFKLDADDPAVDPYLKAAMKRAVAEVMAWRLRQVRVDPMVTTESGEGKSKTYRMDANEPFPQGWERWLDNFEATEPMWWL